MAYDLDLADRIRTYLLAFPELQIEEKKMFRGLTFMIDGKMCVSVSGMNLMCRFDPALQETVAERNGFAPMLMKGREYKGFCYVDPLGFRSRKDFTWWMDLCLSYNKQAKAAKKRGSGPAAPKKRST